MHDRFRVRLAAKSVALRLKLSAQLRKFSTMLWITTRSPAIEMRVAFV
jgi:hypothetical protein